MAPEKPTPIEHPPPADTSSDDEEEVSNEEEEDDDDDEEESDESEEEEAPQPTQPKASANAPKIHIKKSDPKPASPDDRSDSGSDSEATPPAPDLSKSVTVAIPSPAPVVKSAKKRPADSKDYAKNFKKLKDMDDRKKTEQEEAKKVGEDLKKQLFQRLFSEEDEIELLKGMLKYSAEKGVDPAEDLNGFHQYVKSAIHVDVTSTQLSDKIRRLKKKYQKNVNRKSKQGVERSFSKPFEQLSYDLSKKIWGTGNVKADLKPAAVAKSVSANGGFEVKANGKGKRTPKPNMTPDQKEKHASSLQIPSPAKNEKEHVRLDGSPSLSLSEVIKSKDAAGMGLSDEFFKKGLDLLRDDVKAGLEEKWKGLLVAEAELYYRRLELTREQVKLTLDAFKS